jgi:hypothetical protein
MTMILVLPGDGVLVYSQECMAKNQAPIMSLAAIAEVASRR